MDWSFDAWPSGEPYEWGSAGRGHTIYDSTDFHVDLGCGKLKKGRIGIDRYPAPGVNVVMNLDSGQVAALAPEPGRDAVDVVEGGLRYHWPTRGLREVDPWLDYPSMPDFGIRYQHTAEAYSIEFGLPFADSSIKSIISHHAMEHISEGFIPLIDDVYRVLERGGIFYVITPLFPSRSAVEDPDHKRYFMCNEDSCTFDAFCGHLGDENNPTGSWLDSFSVPYTKARFELLHKDFTAPTPAHKQWGPEDVREMRVALRAVK